MSDDTILMVALWISVASLAISLTTLVRLVAFLVGGQTSSGKPSDMALRALRDERVFTDQVIGRGRVTKEQK